MTTVGSYPRTELTKAKTSLSFAKKRLEQAQRDVQHFETKIETLQKESK